jgi:hypothetical protein
MPGTTTVATPNVTVLLYGKYVNEPGYVLLMTQIPLTVSNNIMPPANGIDPTNIIISQTPMDDTIRTPQTHVRLSYASNFKAEPLLIATFFSTVTTGLQLRMCAFNSTGTPGIPVDFTTACQGNFIIPNIGKLIFVTSNTASYNLGGFVVQCSIGQTDQAFLLVQINAFCNTNASGRVLSNGPIYSAVYWRHFPNEGPLGYTLYPIGGAANPYFLASNQEIAFSDDVLPLWKYPPP